MKRVLCLGGLLFIAWGLQGCAAGYQEETDHMIAATQQLNQNLTQALSKGDIDGVMACYWRNPELTVYLPGMMEAQGWDATRTGVSETLKFMPGAKLDLIGSHYERLGDAVVCWGLWKMSVPASHGSVTYELGRYTAVAMEKDGRWVLIHDHASAPLPPPSLNK